MVPGHRPFTPSPLGCVLHGWALTARDVTPAPRPAPRGLILDLDDTLYPREHYVQSGLMAVARHLEERFSISAMDVFSVMTAAHREPRRGFELQAACARFDLPATLVPELLDVFRRHRPLLRLPQATASLLAALRADAWQLAILTNGLPAVQRLKIDSLGLSAIVRDIVYAEEHAEGGKPSASAFRAALRRLALPASRVVMVGDDPVCDIAGARAVGLKTVRLAVPGQRLQPGAGADADAVIDSLDALPRAAAGLLDTVIANAA
jgi:putative hydrolase of the HAD superfamily